MLTFLKYGIVEQGRNNNYEKIIFDFSERERERERERE